MSTRVNSFALYGDHSRWASGIGINLRQHFALYPGWTLWAHVDRDSDDGYMRVIKALVAHGLMKLATMPAAGQSRMMLWRLLPLWQDTEYVFCRDLDSVLTPRQLQCVRSFLASGKIAHGVNDNCAHDIPIMGGMCGFKTSEFQQRIGHKPWQELLDGKYPDEDWNRHGNDQDFLMRHLHPIFEDSFMHHKLEGPNDRASMKQVTDADISDIAGEIRRRGDDFCSFIGASGLQTEHGHYCGAEINAFYDEFGPAECREIRRIERELGWTW